jgi:hypothetical protein
MAPGRIDVVESDHTEETQPMTMENFIPQGDSKYTVQISTGNHS